MSKSSKVVPGSIVEGFVVCPFDNVHRLLPSRLAVHLVRCARNFPSAKMVRCPFNVTHVHSVADMMTHVACCPNRSTMVHYMNPETLPPVEPRPADFCVQSAEDWDAEPPAKTYNPRTHCENNFLILNPQGNAPAVRREIRERERRRFLQNNQF
ncbi:gametocyte-specific factor 1 homolog [Drosophila serrata]|uniref:gametocyte-specific factor 1 homolog n=1 Tax=Drosophila serrata TaxID=7274 RepID=UPI000A1D3315|nr:gametocyte-specific factor 1 homolog [Drosophila serrata]